MNLIDAVTQATYWTGEIMTSVTPDRYSRPTPCPEWDVRALANHLVGGTWTFAQALSGAPSPSLLPADLIGGDAAGAYAAAAGALRAAGSDPAAWERPAAIWLGTVPGHVALSFAVVENLVHGWDLGTALGLDPALPAELAAPAESFARSSVAEHLRGPGGPFGRPAPVGSHAEAGDRLIAFLGRVHDVEFAPAE